ncbi:MAG: YsnF/AvaK domain-containing protein [Elainella sp. Prado103]|nr:YsnF/AvaK domain-containing protein [Elainella sp. Prado103]
MQLTQISATDPRYQHTLGDIRIHHFSVLIGSQVSIGQVVDVLVDEFNQLYILVLSDPSSAQGNLLPLSHFQILPEKRQVWLEEEGKNLPVRSDLGNASSLSPSIVMNPVEVSLPLEASGSLEAPHRMVSRERISPEQPKVSSAPLETLQPIEPSKPADILPPVASSDISSGTASEHIIPLLEERLIVRKQRHKMGEVIVRKVVETQIIQVPIRRERLVIEQISPEYRELASIDLGALSINTIRSSTQSNEQASNVTRDHLMPPNQDSQQPSAS